MYPPKLAPTDPIYSNVGLPDFKARALNVEALLPKLAHGKAVQRMVPHL
jgi:hypothetical protein